MIFQRLRAGTQGLVRPALVLAAVAVCGLISSEPARAALVYTGSNNSAIVFGATTYGGGAQVTPQWIPNINTGLNDILASPGGTFQLANPVIGNNVAGVGPAAYGPGVYQYLNWTGGVSGDGSTFGTGAATIYGPSAGFGLTDSTPGGHGTASYGIETWNSYYTQTTAYNGTFGTYLSIGGNVGIVNSSAVAAVQTEVFVTPHGGATTEYVFAPLILAIGNLGGGNYTYVALSDANAASGAAIVVNPLTGAFSGLAIDNYAAIFSANTSIKVTSTLTFYADPASIDSISPDLSLLPGLSLPGESFGGSGVPEPGTMISGGTALVVLSVLGWLRRRNGRVS
ncbi:MAG: hypothetical protein ACLQGP_14420 [Isosphaeraceae bacterium]